MAASTRSRQSKKISSVEETVPKKTVTSRKKKPLQGSIDSQKKILEDTEQDVNRKPSKLTGTSKKKSNSTSKTSKRGSNTVDFASLDSMMYSTDNNQTDKRQEPKNGKKLSFKKEQIVQKAELDNKENQIDQQNQQQPNKNFQIDIQPSETERSRTQTSRKSNRTSSTSKTSSLSEASLEKVPSKSKKASIVDDNSILSTLSSSSSTKATARVANMTKNKRRSSSKKNKELTPIVLPESVIIVTHDENKKSINNSVEKTSSILSTTTKGTKKTTSTGRRGRNPVAVAINAKEDDHTVLQEDELLEISPSKENTKKQSAAANNTTDDNLIDENNETSLNIKRPRKRVSTTKKSSQNEQIDSPEAGNIPDELKKSTPAKRGRRPRTTNKTSLVEALDQQVLEPVNEKSDENLSADNQKSLKNITKIENPSRSTRNTKKSKKLNQETQNFEAGVDSSMIPAEESCAVEDMDIHEKPKRKRRPVKASKKNETNQTNTETVKRTSRRKKQVEVVVDVQQVHEVVEPMTISLNPIETCEETDCDVPIMEHIDSSLTAQVVEVIDYQNNNELVVMEDTNNTIEEMNGKLIAKNKKPLAKEKLKKTVSFAEKVKVSILDPPQYEQSSCEPNDGFYFNEEEFSKNRPSTIVEFAEKWKMPLENLSARELKRKYLMNYDKYYPKSLTFSKPKQQDAPKELLSMDYDVKYQNLFSNVVEKGLVSYFSDLNKRYLTDLYGKYQQNLSKNHKPTTTSVIRAFNLGMDWILYDDIRIDYLYQVVDELESKQMMKKNERLKRREIERPERIANVKRMRLEEQGNDDFVLNTRTKSVAADGKDGTIKKSGSMKTEFPKELDDLIYKPDLRNTKMEPSLHTNRVRMAKNGKVSERVKLLGKIDEILLNEKEQQLDKLDEMQVLDEEEMEEQEYGEPLKIIQLAQERPVSEDQMWAYRTLEEVDLFCPIFVSIRDEQGHVKPYEDLVYKDQPKGEILIDVCANVMMKMTLNEPGTASNVKEFEYVHLRLFARSEKKMSLWGMGRPKGTPLHAPLQKCVHIPLAKGMKLNIDPNDDRIVYLKVEEDVYGFLFLVPGRPEQFLADVRILIQVLEGKL